MNPIVFTQGDRLFWLEQGTLWTWSRVLWRWWQLPPRKELTINGAVLPRSELLQVISEKGTPFFPRVEAGAWLPCAQCGQVNGPLRTYLGTRPFCSTRHRDEFLRARPVVDSEATNRVNR